MINVFRTSLQLKRCGICNRPIPGTAPGQSRRYVEAFGVAWCSVCAVALELHTIKEGTPSEPQNRGIQR